MIQEHIERTKERIAALEKMAADYEAYLRALARQLDTTYTDLRKNTARASQIAADLQSSVLPSISSPKQRQYVLAAIDFLNSYRSL